EVLVAMLWFGDRIRGLHLGACILIEHPGLVELDFIIRLVLRSDDVDYAARILCGGRITNREHIRRQALDRPVCAVILRQSRVSSVLVNVLLVLRIEIACEEEPPARKPDDAGPLAAHEL